MNALKRRFTDHPATVEQTYFQHFMFSASFSMRLLVASFTAIVHAFIPCVFIKTTGQSIEELNRRMQQQHGAE